MFYQRKSFCYPIIPMPGNALLDEIFRGKRRIIQHGGDRWKHPPLLSNWTHDFAFTNTVPFLVLCKICHMSVERIHGALWSCRVCVQLQLLCLRVLPIVSIRWKFWSRFVFIGSLSLRITKYKLEAFVEISYLESCGDRIQMYGQFWNST